MPPGPPSSVPQMPATKPEDQQPPVFGSYPQNQPYLGSLPPLQPYYEISDPHTIAAILRDSFWFSQGDPEAQWLFLAWMARRYPQMRFARLFPQAVMEVVTLSATIANNPHLHMPVYQDSGLLPPNPHGEANQRYLEMTQVVNIHRLPPTILEDDEFMRNAFEISPEALLDNLLASMIESDYRHLVQIGARERVPSNVLMPATDPYLSHVCHYVIPEGHVNFPHEIPTTEIFQQLCSELLPRLQLLVRGDYASLTLPKERCKELLSMLNAIVKVHNKRHKGVNVNLKKLKKK